MRNKKNAGFTLLEILLVVAAIAILAGIVIIAINPTKQLGDTRDAQRASDVNTILNAVYQYALDNNGDLPAGIPNGTAAVICNTTDVSPATDCADESFADLGVLFENELYLTALPSDPSCDTTTAPLSTCYEIVKTGNSRVTVSAPGVEQAGTIEVTR